jgi:hypothetical protein
MSPVEDARALVTSLFPDARWAVLAGSVLTSARTPGSDLDIVVFGAGPAYRESRRHRGWPVELFVQNAESLDRFFADEDAARKPTLRRMIATGTPLLGDPSPVRETCAEVLAAGPQPLTHGEIDWLRYAVTDLIDDLVHVIDPGERVTLTGTAWVTLGDAALKLGGSWAGRGKWLLREMTAMDPELASMWLAAAGSPSRVIEFGRRVLEPVGGPLFDGYRTQ